MVRTRSLKAMKPSSAGRPRTGKAASAEIACPGFGGTGRARAQLPCPERHRTNSASDHHRQCRSRQLPDDRRPIYWSIGRQFAGHGAVNHSAEEYVRAYFWHVNSVEGYFSLLKRAIFGCYFHVSEAHLHRYTAERDFVYNHRERLGFDDLARANAALVGAKGKRLTYRKPRGIGASAQPLS